MSNPDGNPPAQPRPGEPLQRLAMWLSAAMLLFIIGYLGYEGWQPSRAAAFEIAVKAPRAVDGAFYVPLVVTNKGDRSAENVAVEAELVHRESGEVVETSRLTLRWAPAHAQRRMVVIFHEDPAGHDLRVRVKGYEQP